MKTKFFFLLSLIFIVGCEEGSSPSSQPPTSGPTQVQRSDVPTCARAILNTSALAQLNERVFFQFARNLNTKCSKPNERKALKKYLENTLSQDTEELFRDIALIFNLKGE
jgi:hypothetical protein